MSAILAIITITGLSGCGSDNGAVRSNNEVSTEAATTAPAAEGKRVYFAAPLFNDAEREYNLKIGSILESYGYEVFLPPLFSEAGISGAPRTYRPFS